jgi:hypothetical protein
MSATETQSSAFTITLTEDERTELLRFLEQVLRDKEIEEHRTEARKFRELVQHEENTLRSLISKLGRP